MKRLLLAAAAAGCVVVPAVSAAQERGGARPDAGQVRRGGQGPNLNRQAPDQGQGQGQGQTPRSREDGNRPGPQVQGQRGRDFAQQGQGGREQSGPGFNGQGPGPQGPGGQGPGGQGPGGQGPNNRGQNGQGRDFNPPPAYRGPNASRPGDFNRYDRWDNRGPRYSRDNPNWWRGRPEFRGYTGARNGFWYFPSYGYIRPEPRYYGYAWRSGDFVPPLYRQYVVVDPVLYGLYWPPPGYQWVYLGRDIVLMQMGAGRIVEVVVGGFF